MDIEIETKKIHNIDKTPVFQQSPFWSEVKWKQGIDSKAFDIKTRLSDIDLAASKKRSVTDDLLVLFQDIGDGYVIGYIPYGPTLKPCDEVKGVFLEELSETLRYHLPRKCILLRFDLLWESPWAKDNSFFNDRGDWEGPPAKVNQEIRLNYMTQNWNLKKANTDILPTDTLFIDLQKDEDRLLREMKPKTRYNTRLSKRKGVQVREAGIDELEVWYQLYRETCNRNKIHFHDISYFKTVLEADVSHARSKAKAEFLIAEADGIPLAAMFLVFAGQRATYLYGASSSTHRNFMAPYRLQFAAMRKAKEYGCTEYDMFGVSPTADPAHPLYGLYRFKTGFGGKLFHRMGCWDYPFDQDIYQAMQIRDATGQGYHLS